jgi:hypothetical protein
LSTQVIKHLAKLYDIPMFASLIAGLNHLEEICMMQLAPTKSTSHMVEGLKELSKNLEENGHRQPILLYTDNVKGQAASLEAALPSLKADVQPVTLENTTSLYAKLPVFEMGANYVVHYIVSPDAADTLLHELIVAKVANNPQADFTVAIDAEWNFPQKGVNKLKTIGKVATFQLGLPECAIVLHVRFFFFLEFVTAALEIKLFSSFLFFIFFFSFKMIALAHDKASKVAEDDSPSSINQESGKEHEHRREKLL